ncbi:MAG: hypothetical protein IJF23_01140 [Clostridia bacterium]|nr:hypothetical protein [Clostridia bacterium]
MLYVKEWDRIKERMSAWWNGELSDRCLVSVIAGKQIKQTDPKIMNLPKNKEDRIKYWTDPEWIIKRNRANMENTWYGGDAFPLINLNLGASGHAGFFKNANYSFEESVWFFPSLSGNNDLEFDENSWLFKQTLEVAKALAEDSKGDYIVSMSDCAGNIDALAHLLGQETLLPLMIEEPETVTASMEKIQTAYENIHKRVFDIVKDVNDGGSSIGWLRTWAPGFHAQLQSDASVMISPEMFREFIEPELRIQCEMLDYSLYHFDGIEQIRHLDCLLSIENLNAIQWTQVAGQPPCTEFIPELQKIQKAGKNLVLGTDINQLKILMENLSSKGLYLLVHASTEEEGKEILDYISKTSHE